MDLSIKQETAGTSTQGHSETAVPDHPYLHPYNEDESKTKTFRHSAQQVTSQVAEQECSTSKLKDQSFPEADECEINNPTAESNNYLHNYCECEICKTKFSDKAQLAQHIKIHIKEETFKCRQCDYQTSVERYFWRHLKRHALIKKSFRCVFCGYKFIHKINLEKHLITHTGEKRFKCDICDYQCTMLSYLQRHMRSHTRQKPFKCNLCDFRSAWKGNVKTHMRIHTRENPFKCNQCSYQCTVEYRLHMHMTTHIK